VERCQRGPEQDVFLSEELRGEGRLLTEIHAPEGEKRKYTGATKKKDLFAQRVIAQEASRWGER